MNLQDSLSRLDSRLGGWRWPLVTLFFTAVTLAWLAPLVPHLNTHVLVGPSDATNGLRMYWAMIESGHTPWTFHHDPLNGAPEGYPHPAPVAIAQPIQPAFFVLLYPLGLVTALNLFIVTGFIATGVAGYSLGTRLRFGFLPSLLLGYIVAFNPWMFRRAFDGHLAFVHGWVLVLVIVASLALVERESIRAALALGASLGLSFWMASYYGLLASLPVGIALVIALARARDLAQRLWWCTLACVTAGTTLAFLLPGAISYFAERDKVNQALDNPLEQLQSRGAELGSYLLPAEGNPVIGSITRQVAPLGLDERMVFFGYSTMLLAAAAVFVAVRRRDIFSPLQRRAILFAGLLVPLAILWSLPRLVHVAGLAIPSPAYLGGEITSFYRFYVRFGYMAGIGFAILAAAMLSVMLRRRAYALAALAVVLCAIELIPGRITTWDAGRAPVYDEWLARQPKGIVAHYPMYTDQQPALDLARLEHYFQRFHGQPQFTIFGSGYGLTREHAIRVLARYVTDPVTPGILAAERVRYVVLHDDVYRAQGEQPPQLSSPTFVERARFPNVRIYEVESDPVDLDRTLLDNAAAIGLTQGLESGDVTFGSGFEPVAEGGHLLSKRFGQVLVSNHGSARFFELRIRVTSQQPSTVTLSDAQGRQVARFNVHPGPTTLLSTRIRQPLGQSMLTLSSSPGRLIVRHAQAAPLADVETRLNRISAPVGSTTIPPEP